MWVWVWVPVDLCINKGMQACPVSEFLCQCRGKAPGVRGWGSV